MDVNPNTEIKRNKKKSFIGIIVFAIVLIAVMCGTYYFSHNYLVIYPVKGQSMENTIHDGENVILFKTTKVKYDDIIVFYVPDENRYLIKRVIGLAGDEIEIKYSYDDSLYHVYRNGAILSEEYIYEPMDKVYTEMKVVVPEGKVFFLGDNRLDSYDSHVGNFYADVNQIQGVAFVKYSDWKSVKFL